MSFFRGACGTSSSGARVKQAVVAAPATSAPPEEGPPCGGFLTVSGPPHGSLAAVWSPADGVWLPPVGDTFWSEGAEVVSQRVHAALARGAQASRAGLHEAPGGTRLEVPDAPPESLGDRASAASPAASAAAEAKTALQAAVDWLQANNKRLKGALASSEQRVRDMEAQLLAASAATAAQAQRADALILQARADGARDARAGKVLADTEEVAKLREELRTTFSAMQAAQKESKKHQTQVLDLRAKLQEQSVEIGALKERMHGRRTLLPVDGPVASAPSSASSAPSEEDVALAVGEASRAMMAARAESAAEKSARLAVSAELEKALSAAASAAAASLSEREAASARERALRATVEALRRSDAELSAAELRQRVRDISSLLTHRDAAETQLDAALGGGANAADVPQQQPLEASVSLQTLSELEALRQEVRRLSHGASREREGRLRAEASLSALSSPLAEDAASAPAPLAQPTAAHTGPHVAAAAPPLVVLQRKGPSPLLDRPVSRLGDGSRLFAPTEPHDELPQPHAPQLQPARASPLAALAARMDQAARGGKPKNAAPKAPPASAAEAPPPFLEVPPVVAAPAGEGGKEGGKSLAEEIAELTASVGSLQAALGAAASSLDE